MAAAGVSTIAPRATGGVGPSSARMSAIMARTAASSERLATIGAMMRSGPAERTRRIARSCVRRSSGRARLTRTPRSPSAGLSSSSIGR